MLPKVDSSSMQVSRPILGGNPFSGSATNRASATTR